VSAVLFAFPFYWLSISSFKNQSQMFTMPPQWLAHPATIINFIQLFEQTNLPRAFVNSAICSAGNVALALFLCSLAGFAFAKYPRAPGCDKLFSFVFGTMLIPGAVLLIPNFLVMVHLHMIDTYWSLIIPGSVSAFGIYWMRNYIQSHVPDDLLSAARIDGCGEFGIYWRIVLPICRPALAALGIMQLIGSWNNLMWAFIVLRTPQMYTLPVVIYLLNGEEKTPYGMLMAGGLLTVLPLVLAFLFFQKQFITGITAGAVKQ
jgi:ABC-type glycerol-3-phosphate transport system permease component